FTGFASRIRSRAAKSAKYENLWVFIRSDAHVVRAGLNIRGCGPLSTPGFFDRLRRLRGIFYLTFIQREYRLNHYGFAVFCNKIFIYNGELLWTI
ncbi:MAG: hypothetical protein U0M40_04930, partial [Christensenellales bacterium]